MACGVSVTFESPDMPHLLRLPLSSIKIGSYSTSTNGKAEQETHYHMAKLKKDMTKIVKDAQVGQQVADLQRYIKLVTASKNTGKEVNINLLEQQGFQALQMFIDSFAASSSSSSSLSRLHPRPLPRRSPSSMRATRSPTAPSVCRVSGRMERPCARATAVTSFAKTASWRRPRPLP